MPLDGEGGGGGLQEGDDAGAAGQLLKEDGGIGEFAALSPVALGEGQGEVAGALEVVPEGLIGAALALKLADAVEGNLVAEVVAEGVAEESLGLAEGLRPCFGYRGRPRPRRAMMSRWTSLAPPPKRWMGEAR